MKLGKKFTLMILTLVFAVGGIVTVINLLKSSRFTEKSVGIQASWVAQTMADSIDPDLFAKIQEIGTMDSPEYKLLHDRLEKTKESLDLKFLYTFTDEGDVIRYVVDGFDPSEPNFSALG